MANIGNENIALHNDNRELKSTLEKMVAEKAELVAERAAFVERESLLRQEIAGLKERCGEVGSPSAGSSPDPSTPPTRPLRSGARLSGKCWSGFIRPT